MDRSAYSASCNGLTAPFLFPPFLCEESWKPKTQQTMTREAPKQKISIICMNEWKQLANSWIIVQLYEESLSGCSWHILHKRTKIITVYIYMQMVDQTNLQKQRVHREYLLALDNWIQSCSGTPIMDTEVYLMLRCWQAALQKTLRKKAKLNTAKWRHSKINSDVITKSHKYKMHGILRP